MIARERVEIESRRAMTPARKARILSKVEFDLNGGCWLWAHARLSGGGYGRITVDGKPSSAHVESWKAFRGPVHGLAVLHKCDVRACVNPGHLFLGSKGENNTDRAKKGRNSDRRGSLNPAAKLTREQVFDIRERISRGERQASISKAFGVTQATICDIKKGRSWPE